MTGYSYWEQGRNLSSGQIVSMTPIELGENALNIGATNLSGAGIALSAVAQFGMYLELRKSNLLKEAEFEERRHGWLDDITKQWIEEHRDQPGIREDITQAVVAECTKLWEKVADNKNVDVSQTLLLRLSRMCEFLECNYQVAASSLEHLVEVSHSDSEWLLDPNTCPKTESHGFLEEALKETKGKWWKGLLKGIGGLPLFLIPGVGAIAGGSAVGYGIGEMIGSLRTTEADFERFQDKIPLLRFGLAASYLEAATLHQDYILDEQDFPEPMKYLVTETADSEVSFVFQPLEGSHSLKGVDDLELKSISLPE